MRLTETLPALLGRRALIAAAIATTACIHHTPPALAADSELWPKDGLFVDCPASDICVSSQDDRPQCWDNPWIFEGSVEDSYLALRRLVEKKLGGKIVADDGERYLKAEFVEKGPLGASVRDVAEWFFAPDDSLVQFRSARSEDGLSTDFGQNRRRMEKARIALGWEKVPVLRNRRRALIVAESPFDSFGPALYSDTYSDKDPLATSFKPPDKFTRAWMRESDDRVRSK